MSQKLSRRDFARKAACVAAGLTVSAVAKTQATQDKQARVSDAEIDAVQVQLAKPLTDEEKVMLKADLASQKKDTAARLKINLPENSEPCFRFVVTPKSKTEDVEEGVG